MAPARQTRESSIEETDEYNAFLSRLQTFHDQRGTNFDPTPKVGTRRVDLLRLYNRVVGDGGYDIVSDTKQSKLAWRKMGVEFNLGTANLPALAFSLKSAYYKNLAAFEIVEVHKRQPPPKEILEDVSAKGGDLLHRTLENFHRSNGRDEPTANGVDHDGSEDDGQGTPRGDRMDIDEPGSGGARAARGLRQAPPQRVLYQSDMSSSRQTRQHSGLGNSPTPSSNLYGSSNGYVPNGLSHALANYEPRQQLPLALRPVVTPGNNPEVFNAQQKALRTRALAKVLKVGQPTKGMMLPGTGFTGPSIYARTLLSLQSGVLEEQEYALHHLVKISHERGDKYRFDGFPGLAEALIEKLLEISSLFSNIEWILSYQEEEPCDGGETLNGLHGTLDIMERIGPNRSRRSQDKIETEEFSRRLNLIVEAGLVIRNMVMLEENAQFLSKLAPIRDALVILLTLPRSPSLVEIQHYGLEIAEQLTRYFSSTPDDPLLISLLAYADGTDRGQIMTSLKSVSRIGVHLEGSIRRQEIPIPTIQRLCEWLLLDDEEVRGACLDILYQFSATIDDVELLLHYVDVGALIKQLVRLLLHGARQDDNKEASKAPPKPLSPGGDVPIPRICTDHVEMLLGYNEPERSSQWLRACFEEAPAGEITQIALWQSYQIPFAPFSAQRPLLPAKDFITNVSTTFTSASAQVMNGPPPRFVIKGIKPRRIPVDPKGREFMRCLWHTDNEVECGEFALWPKSMWEHVVGSHLGIGKDAEGRFDFNPMDARVYGCWWSECKRYAPAERPSPFKLGMHVKTHMPDSSERSYHRGKHNKSNLLKAPNSQSWPLRNTPKDERNDAVGLPLTSVLVLRNLARIIPKTPTGSIQAEESLVWKVFAPVKEQLFYVMAHNLSLRDYLPSLTKAIIAGGG